MGYRWHDNRLIDDEEFWLPYEDPIGFAHAIANFFGIMGAIFVPSIGLAILGYLITTSGVGILIGIGLGITLSIIFYKLLQVIFRIITWILMIGFILSLLGGLIYAILLI